MTTGAAMTDDERAARQHLERVLLALAQASELLPDARSDGWTNAFTAAAVWLEDGTPTLPPDFMPGEPEHDELSARIPSLGAASLAYDPHALAVLLPCPRGPDAAALNLAGWCTPVRPVAQVCQHKQVDGALWLVLRCPYCGVKWRVPPEWGAKLVAHLGAAYPQDRFIMAIAARIDAGYARQLGG